MSSRDTPRPAAVVTGASGSVGGAIARRLGVLGHPVVLIGRSSERLAQVASDMGTMTRTMAGELTDPAFVDAVATDGHEGMGVIGVLVNAAGAFGPVGPTESIDMDHWEATMSLNATAPLRLIQKFLPEMTRRGWGRIVNVSSAQTLYGPDPLVSAYATSKHALNWITRCVATETAGTDVAACAIHPGDLKSGMWDDIRRKAQMWPDTAAHLHEWAELVDRTGGDAPEATADLVEEIVTRPAAHSNGRFLMIADGIVDHAPPTW